MTEHKNSAAKIRANNKYVAKTYDRINIVVPKGQKRTVEAFAEKMGISINKLLERALLAFMGLESWPVIEKKEE